jgi:hypothetical protein
VTVFSLDLARRASVFNRFGIATRLACIPIVSVRIDAAGSSAETKSFGRKGCHARWPKCNTIGRQEDGKRTIAPSSPLRLK